MLSSTARLGKPKEGNPLTGHFQGPLLDPVGVVASLHPLSSLAPPVPAQQPRAQSGDWDCWAQDS